ncbi:MAG: PP0621 family protein [Burkholderiales bacterium]|nr:PP0621 family protein [Burkholderiales bacterium]MDZ4359077.1 PP0621 family protein [Variovorax sp.]
MKYLLVLAVVFVAALIWRSNRRSGESGDTAARGKAAPPRELENMVHCPVCSVHLPLADAVPGKRASYCCVAHRQQAEG